MENNEVAASNSSEDEFVKELAQVYKLLKLSKNLNKAMKEVEGNLLSMMGGQLFTIYQSVDNGKEIIASFMGGGRLSDVV